MNKNFKNGMKLFAATVVATSFAACGGGGGGGGGGGQVVYYPYETVYGDVCKTQEASPGCTFLESNGQRIKVTDDPHYGRTGHGSDDLWYVEFDSSGKAAVYNDLGQFQYYAGVHEFAGYIGGNTIGVGTTGLYWEDVSNGTYWLGKNGVLYSANSGEGNYGQAINDEASTEASDTNFAALNSDSNKQLVKMASEKLMNEYGFKQDKAIAVASALNSWAVAAAERGATSEKDMDKTFKAVFGVQFGDALAAVKDLSMGDKAAMQDLTNRSASALGLKPHQAQKFMKGMYKKALANWGYDESFSW
ncbi:hypothetical protein ACES2L_10025 [Bdellovibrio bacteriovorus]